MPILPLLALLGPLGDAPPVVGLRVIRVTWRQIAEGPEALLVRLARALDA